MGDTLGAAVIGLGVMGQQHARIWSELPGTRVVSVYDVAPGRAAELAARCGAVAAESLEAALSAHGVDLVSVCTDDQSHLEPCVAAAEAGKHVLVEKPLAMSLADADAIIAACERNGVVLMVGHVVRFDPRYTTARQAIEEGAVGEVIHVYGRRNNLISSGLRVGGRTSVAFFLGSHDLDLMRWFVGAEVVSVYAESSRKALVETGADDTIFTLLKYDNGAVGCLETCWAIPPGVPNALDARLEVVGTRGRVAVRAGGESLEVSGPERSDRLDVIYGPEIAGLQHGALRTQLEHFADCARTGRQPVITPADARAAVEICVAIHESLATGAPVKLR
jgi:UDP-N-acetylglucosamine 3-dehydrogenase